MPVIPILGRLRQENYLKPGGGGCGVLRWHHCTPAWATRAKLHLKTKQKTTTTKEPNYNYLAKQHVMGNDNQIFVVISRKQLLKF